MQGKGKECKVKGKQNKKDLSILLHSMALQLRQGQEHEATTSKVERQDETASACLRLQNDHVIKGDKYR